VNSSNPIQLILDFISGLFSDVGIGWYESLQILIINLVNSIFGG